MATLLIPIAAIILLLLTDPLKAERLSLTSATITLTKTAVKDALTFTGKHPSTVLTEQDVQRESELTITFGIRIEDSDNEMAIFPQQCFLMVQGKGSDTAMYQSARLHDAKLTIKTDVAATLRRLGRHEYMELSLIVGDPRFDEGLLWNLGTIRLDRSIVDDTMIARPTPPRRLHDSKPKPDIVHIFREPDPRPQAALPFLFTVLTLIPLMTFLLWAKFIGMNFEGVPSRSARIWVVLFHTGLGLILILYLLFFFRLNLFQMAAPLSSLAVFCFFTGHRVLCAVAGARSKEKLQ